MFMLIHAGVGDSEVNGLRMLEELYHFEVAVEESEDHGYFRSARHGTLFLDEIGETPPRSRCCC